MAERSRAASELPEPSAELVLFRVHVEAMLAVMGPKKGERYLRLMAEKLASEENLSALFHIRPRSDDAAVQRARSQAAELFRRHLPIFLARIGGG